MVFPRLACATRCGGVFEREAYPALVDDRVNIRWEMTARGVVLEREICGLGVRAGGVSGEARRIFDGFDGKPDALFFRVSR